MFKFKHKKFNLLKVITKNELPGYIKHYISDDELIFSAYKTARDYSVFTEKKLVVFDNKKGIKLRKRIYSIYYKAISVLDITFENRKVIINMQLNNESSVKIKFNNVKPEDKVRLRLIYTCINRIVSNQEPLEEDIKKLTGNKFNVKVRKSSK